MKELVKYIVTPIVEFPEQIDTRETEGEKSTVIELRVAESDLGKVIGKQGRTAKAIRTLLSAASARAGKRYTLEIIED
ncbi:MAG: KH domain-containing protein [Deferribacterales bacterium]|nr:KH domain-containing protein [Deferribacterales bacterium]